MQKRYYRAFLLIISFRSYIHSKCFRKNTNMYSVVILKENSTYSIWFTMLCFHQPFSTGVDSSVSQSLVSCQTFMELTAWRLRFSFQTKASASVCESTIATNEKQSCLVNYFIVLGYPWNKTMIQRELPLDPQSGKFPKFLITNEGLFTLLAGVFYAPFIRCGKNISLVSLVGTSIINKFT
jgi:hypothetical protein